MSLNPCIYVVFMLLWSCQGSHDVEDFELRYLADHINATDCRRLVEALHVNSLFLVESPTGAGVPRNLTCIELLEQWDKKESRTESFVRLAERLRELGYVELAKRFSQAVLKAKGTAVNALVLNELTTGSSKLEEEEVILIDSPRLNRDVNAHIAVFDGRDGNTANWIFPNWTLSQKVLFVISTVFTVGLFGFWFFHCIPDCVRALCEICRRKPHRNGDDAAHFLLTELDDTDA